VLSRSVELMKMMRRWSRVVLGLVSLVVFTRVGSAEDTLISFSDQYQGKTLILRNFWNDDHLQYDSAGKVLGSPRSGSWTTNGFVQIVQVTASPNGLELQCKRLVVARTKWVYHHEPVTLDLLEGRHSLTIQIALDPKGASSEQIESTLSRVFVRNDENLVDLVPDYWKACLRAALSGTGESGPSKCIFADRLHLAVTSNTAPVEAAVLQVDYSNGTLRPEWPMYRPGTDAVSPPRINSDVAPERTEESKVVRYLGSIELQLTVDAEGHARDLCITRPLGYGMDERVIEVVTNSKFEPARKQGKRVPLTMSFQVGL
jgi:hypothetical protein